MCRGIELNSPLAHLLKLTKFIIWDEAPMTHKHCFDFVARSLRNVIHCSNNKLFELSFGGKIVVFGDDFRQGFLVISKCTS